jgi:hypothetical protein
MIDFTLVEDAGLRVLEGDPDRLLIGGAADANRLLEACFSNGARCALLHAGNLSRRFFDLSSGEAGAILQKLRNYGVTLAVVCPPGTIRFSSHFGEMLAEEQPRGRFGVFESRQAARNWLCDNAVR